MFNTSVSPELPETTESHNDDGNESTDGPYKTFSFLLVPISVIVIVTILTSVVVLFLRKKRLDRLRHHLMPFYNFDPGEEGEDWEAELLDDSADCNLKKGYKSIVDPPRAAT